MSPLLQYSIAVLLCDVQLTYRMVSYYRVQTVAGPGLALAWICLEAATWKIFRFLSFAYGGSTGGAGGLIIGRLAFTATSVVVVFTPVV